MKINYMRFISILYALIISVLATPYCMNAQTIAEKKAGGGESSDDLTQEMQRHLQQVNQELNTSQAELRRLYSKVEELYTGEASDGSFLDLLNHINEIRARIDRLETNWREMAVQGGQMDAYALWHQPETTIGQLVMDYGSQDYVYLLSSEIANMRINVDSNLPIPRASWGEMLELILVQNGIGYKQLNPYLRQLFLLKEDRSAIKAITNQRGELEFFAPEARVAFVLTPEPAEVRRIWQFLERFANQNTTLLQLIGRDILIIGPVSDVKDLLRMYDFVVANKGEKEYKVFPMTRVDAEEMARILAAIFDQVVGGSSGVVMPTPTGVGLPEGGGGGPRPPSQMPRAPIPIPIPVSAQASNAQNVESNGLKIITLGHIAKALFLVGTKEEIRKAEQIIKQVESQVGEARERIIYWYTAKHSDPEELADILEKIYYLMVRTGVGFAPPPYMGIGPPPPPIQVQPLPTPGEIANQILARERDALPSELYQNSYYQQGGYVVNPAPVEPRLTKSPTPNRNRENFIVDLKTGAIAMVVEADILPKIKELIKKLDVPKRMVQIEALLFERRVIKQNNFGLNLLRIGSCATNKNSTCLTWNDPLINPAGVLDFVLSRAKNCVLPAYDLAYRFLMTQEDVQLNASPSVVAVNQTPATIAIVEEVSINTGIYNVETAKGVTLERAFTRAQYGITIDITPIIHITENGDTADEPNYVTLDTDITFDSFLPGSDPERPDVIRRHITNEVRIPDGQTVILGGLRRKNTDDTRESIPFIGELPGIGKLFSMREVSENETEMFIFLTPTIISDPLEDFERIKCAEMRRRPGDVPEFLCCLAAAMEMEKNRLMDGTMTLLFGLEPDRCHSPSYWRPSNCCPSMDEGYYSNVAGCPSYGEYDGR